MPATICPRCNHVNPDYAVYCYFDGGMLQAQQNVAVSRLPTIFVFPSGRRCQTFEELAQGCQEEWTSARDLLQRGVFGNYFRTCHRADLERAANEAKGQANPDMALSSFVTTLPGVRTQVPKLDLNPRRVLLGNLVVGEARAFMVSVLNQGQGTLQGTVSITEGQDWLSLGETSPVHQLPVNTAREQQIKLIINTRGVAAGQTYGAKLVVVTNGGVGEVPLRMDLLAQPYPRPPYQGIRSQRELAEHMRMQPKLAVPVLESGDVQRWFTLNGWTYPVSGPAVKGVGGVQQFFEGMGVSKPPPVQLSQQEFRFTCNYRQTVRGQVTLQTNIKKWVYGQLYSDSSWLKVLTPLISGPQFAVAQFEVDTNLWNQGPTGEGRIAFLTNGGQKLMLKIGVNVLGAPAPQMPRPAAPVQAPAPVPVAVPQPVTRPVMQAPTQAVPRPVTAAPMPVHPVPAPMPVAPASIVPARPPQPSPVMAVPPFAVPTPAYPHPVAYPSAAMPSVQSAVRMKFVPALLTTVIVCLLLRGLMVPLSDMAARSSVAAAAVQKLGVAPAEGSPFEEIGGWLQLPWLPILGGADDTFSASVFQPNSNKELRTVDFRHYFSSYFIRWFVLRLGWLGAIVGVIVVLRRGGGALDVLWGIVAGIGAGFVVSATVASFFLMAELIPHTIWSVLFAGHAGLDYLLMWSGIALVCWLLLGVGLGIVLPWITPLRRLLINPFQRLFASGFRLLGMRSLADYWAPA